MRKSLLRPFDLRATVVRNMPWASGLMAMVVALAAAQKEWGSAAYFSLFLIAFVAARWFASDVLRWNRYMAWLPDELKGSK